MAELKAKRKTAASNRAKKFGAFWKEADMGEAIERLIPNAIVNEPNLHGKVIIGSPESKISIVCDLFGGYFKVQHNETKEYLDLNGNSIRNITENGKTRGRSKKEFRKLTHFKMR